MYKKWLSLLRNVELFKNIEVQELDAMLSCLRPSIVTYQKKEYIAIEGHTFNGIGIVVEGEIIISKENIVGDRVVMGKFKEGSMFGEMIAFSNKNLWPASVMALDNCIILFITSDKILGNCNKMCIGHKLLIQNMLKIVSQKALSLNRKIEYLSMKSIRAKISSYLLEQYTTKNQSKFTISLKRNELAEFLNISRPSLSREIIKMKDENIIDFYKSSFEIIDIELLKLGV